MLSICKGTQWTLLVQQRRIGTEKGKTGQRKTKIQERKHQISQWLIWHLGLICALTILGISASSALLPAAHIALILSHLLSMLKAFQGGMSHSFGIFKILGSPLQLRFHLQTSSIQWPRRASFQVIWPCHISWPCIFLELGSSLWNSVTLAFCVPIEPAPCIYHCEVLLPDHIVVWPLYPWLQKLLSSWEVEYNIFLGDCFSPGNLGQILFCSGILPFKWICILCPLAFDGSYPQGTTPISPV